MQLLRVQIGLPRTYGSPDAADPFDREWMSGFQKLPVEGPVDVHAEGLVGDGQADRQHHGGPDKAINVYPVAHYPFWENRLGRSLPSGAFGENFTMADATEETVCVGDRYALGSVCFEVSQPRQPCWKLGRYWRVKDLAAQVQKNGKTGWYLRVLSGGRLTAPATLTRCACPFPDWTIARANAIMHQRAGGASAAAALAACPALSTSWRTTLQARSEIPTSKDADAEKRRLGWS